MARQARSLTTLLAEVNAAAPKRSKLSDGGLGDDKHSKVKSDHNPNAAGVWRARDFTNDPAGGLDCDALAAELVAKLGRHPALGSGAYLIWERRIISTDRLREGWRRYSGLNAHEKHLHVSVATDDDGYDSTAAWNILATQAAPAPTTEDDMLIVARTNTDPTLWLCNGVERRRIDSTSTWKDIQWLSRQGIQPVYNHGDPNNGGVVFVDNLWALGFPVDVAHDQTVAALNDDPDLTEVMAKLDKITKAEIDPAQLERIVDTIEALPPAVASEVGQRLVSGAV